MKKALTNDKIDPYESSLKKIKSRYIFQKVFANLTQTKILELIRYCKRLQCKFNKRKYDYIKEYSKIEIEIFPTENTSGHFINFTKANEPYYHIYFNDDRKEMKKYFINKEDKVNKIKMIIDHDVKTLNGLFDKCECIKSINFTKFNRNNIDNMSKMFYGCSSLIEVNFSKFNTDKVRRMISMFEYCSSLEKLDLSNYNTDKVRNMSCMFSNCYSLKELNISNFITKM